MTIFNYGNYTLPSGGRSRWKLDLSELNDEEWVEIADIAIRCLPLFGSVESVPTGGDKLANILHAHRRKDHPNILIVEDVITTGQSMELIRDGRDDAVGLAVFSRMNPPPPWVTPLFYCSPHLKNV